MPESTAGPAPVARPSATVALIREGERAPQLLMLRRHAGSVFGDVYVFPGGAVDACDSRVRDRCGAVDGAAATACLGVTEALDYYSAAIREVFEETGVLLAHGGTAVDDASLDDDRRRLMRGELAWDRFLQERNLCLESERLHYFAHWVTPETESRRFSTRFFLAAMPEQQQASHDGSELTDSCWMTAAEVLEAQRAGRMRLIFPTYRTLKDIAGLETVDAVIEWARARQRSGVARILPAIIEIDGKEKVVMPGDPRYPRNGGL
ncbi:MAG: NUDIX domain-containing protein [Woeseiaceae bacterium]|nr:NUDIX domain-containing protein [Woeseiaceae bacterium]